MTTKTQSPINNELNAIRRIENALKGLTANQKIRTLNFVWAEPR